jgi:WD40 repeat protein
VYQVLDADMSPNLQLVVSASADKTVRMWPARGGKVTQAMV